MSWRLQSSETAWKPSSALPHSFSCSASWYPRRGLLFLSLSRQVRVPPLGEEASGEALMLGVRGGELADVFTKIWLELVVGGAGDVYKKLTGRWRGGCLFLRSRPLREDLIWACCSASCWLSTCCWRRRWKSSWGEPGEKKRLRANHIRAFCIKRLFASVKLS